MKTKITFLVALCLLAISNVWATKHPVTTTAEFTTAWGAYVAGDTIVMSTGTYSGFGDKNITKSVTIMSADTTSTDRPIIVAGQFIFTQPNCSFVINGIEAYYYTEAASVTDSKYFLQAVANTMSTGTIPLISLRNCTIHGYSRGLIRADNTTAANIPTIPEIFINNCLLYDISRVRADYTALGLKAAKMTKVTIKNTTFYNSPCGFFYSENTDTPVNLLIENCCLIKLTNNTTTGTQTNASKMIIYNNGNAGSTRTIKNTIISDSFDGSTERMQIKLGSDGTTNWGNADNVVFGNNMNAAIFTSTVLTVNNQTTATSLSYNYPAMTITTDPITINNLGDPRWRINGVWTNAISKSESNIFANIHNNQLTIGNLPLNSTINVYSFAGSRLFSKKNSGSILQVPVNYSCIVKVTSDKETVSLKVIK
ncbi:MAG TPA: hypothetical protein P5084_09790 [Paludibacter sp.]|nr:hypothetical protein [Paludibacter sp.]